MLDVIDSKCLLAAVPCALPRVSHSGFLRSRVHFLSLCLLKRVAFIKNDRLLFCPKHCAVQEDFQTSFHQMSVVPPCHL